MTFYGFNAHAQGIKDVAVLLRRVGKLRPAWMLVMDSLDLCKQILNASPETNVIHRNYAITDGDDDVHKKISPAAWLALRASEAEANVWLHTTCEPGWSQEVIDWHVELMKLAIPRKVKLLIGNWSVGTPQPDNIKMAKTLLQMLDMHRDQFVLGLHEYANAVITSGLVGGGPDGKTEKGETVHPDYRLPGSWPQGDAANGLTHWHMGRYRFWLKYCREVGIKPPRIVMTEVGFDDVSDIGWWTRTLPRTGAYTSIGGFKTLQSYWRQIFPQWSEDRAYYEQLKYAEKQIYQDEAVEGGCVYCYGHVDPKWDVDDVEGHSELLDYMEADVTTKKRITQAMTPVISLPEGVYGQRYSLSLPGEIVNAYAEPSLTSGSMGTIPQAAVVMYVDERMVGDVKWWRVKYLAMTGWIDTTTVKISLYVPPPAEPAPIPTPPLELSPMPAPEPMKRVQLSLEVLGTDTQIKFMVMGLEKMIEGCGYFGAAAGAVVSVKPVEVSVAVAVK